MFTTTLMITLFTVLIQGGPPFRLIYLLLRNDYSFTFENESTSWSKL